MTNEAFDEQWQGLLTVLATSDRAPSGLLLAHPHTVLKSVKAQWGSEREAISEAMGQAVAATAKKYGRSVIPGSQKTGIDLLADAAGYQGITGELKQALKNSRAVKVQEALAANPYVPAELIPGLVKYGNREVRSELSANLQTPADIRGRLLAKGDGTLHAANRLAQKDQAHVEEVVKIVLEAGRGELHVLKAAGRYQVKEYPLLLARAAERLRMRVRAQDVCSPESDHRLYQLLREAQDKGSTACKAALQEYTLLLAESPQTQSVREWVGGLDLSDPELGKQILGEDTFLQNFALARRDVTSEHVLRVLREQGSQVGDISERRLGAVLEGDELLQAIELVLQTPHKGAAVGLLLEAAKKAELTALEGVIKKCQEHAPHKEWAWRSTWKVLVRRHGEAAYSHVAPPRALLVCFPVEAVSQYLSKELEPRELEAYLTLGPTWEGTVGELMETVRSL